ncbi:hypothetical protein DLR11_22435 [Salmonella enterica subsp. salamae]|uniref:Uncharacterized protein n=1 Tax=Salmonella enterica subsp. salamae TaxID=59202 RepID=A0A5Y3UZK2_SALER|nr:hypothetical protein [Salmonella enterica subsp. salamae]EEL7718619.1 hypothetical protein [Salmonella enterica]ECC1654506.1 hypothetical protein [Salmonella enterica subsp. salamae]ECC1694242.1 hypothetical protein [Salmonella enterica subsp. salamae]ECD9414711.1 hypothetical protein [Salmonella enterica subsp. salamae]
MTMVSVAQGQCHTPIDNNPMLLFQPYDYSQYYLVRPVVFLLTPVGFYLKYFWLRDLLFAPDA